MDARIALRLYALKSQPGLLQGTDNCSRLETVCGQISDSTAQISGPWKPSPKYWHRVMDFCRVVSGKIWEKHMRPAMQHHSGRAQIHLPLIRNFKSAKNRHSFPVASNPRGLQDSAIAQSSPFPDQARRSAMNEATRRAKVRR